MEKSKTEYVKRFPVVYEIVARLSAYETGEIKEIGKSANDHEAIISAIFTRNGNLVQRVLVFSGTSDNESSVALRVDRYRNYSGAVRCICYTIHLAVNAAVHDTDFLSNVLMQIKTVTEMFLMIRGYLRSRIDFVSRQNGFICARAQSQDDLATEIACQIESIDNVSPISCECDEKAGEEQLIAFACLRCVFICLAMRIIPVRITFPSCTCYLGRPSTEG
eukprot:IDg19953t1